MGPHSNVNYAATRDVIIAAVATIGCVVAMTNSAISTVAMVIFGALATLFVAAGSASISAWYRTNSGNVAEYEVNAVNDFQFGLTGAVAYIASSLFKAVINGCTSAVSGIIHDRIRYGR